MIEEKDRRLELVRQYMMDVELNPNGLLESNDAVSYVRYNFQEAVKAAMVEMDQRRRITRTLSAHKVLMEDKLETVEISSPMVELHIGRMSNVIQTGAKFSFWFHRTLLSPIVNEEDRILRYSSSAKILNAGTIRSYVDRVAEIFRFKLWEDVHFPDAKAVPPRVEPVPDEASSETKKLE